jgi:hypothetical protein
VYTPPASAKAADIALFVKPMQNIRFTFLLLFICLSNSLNAQTVDTPTVITAGTYELKGSIGSLQERNFVYSDGEPELAWEKEIRFDAANRVEITKELMSGEKEPVVKRYSYNDAGKLLSEAILSGSKEYDSTAYTYNHAGELRQKTLFDAGKRHQTTRYNYRDGKLSYIRCDGGNGLVSMIRFRYNGANEYRRNVLDGLLKYSYSELITEEKDAAGARRWSRYLYPSPDSCSNQLTHIYDALGKLTEDITTGPDKKVKQYITNTYNKHGLLDEQVWFVNEVKTTTGYTYRFDNDGNWIERSKYAEGKVLETTARMITYRKADNKKAAHTSGIKVIQQ